LDFHLDSGNGSLPGSLAIRCARRNAVGWDPSEALINQMYRVELAIFAMCHSTIPAGTMGEGCNLADRMFVG
jgi:hypothetical protein